MVKGYYKMISGVYSVINPLLLKTECYRDESWKFIRYEDHPGFFELYNFKEDVNEVNNLALDKNYMVKMEFYKQKCDSTVRKLLSNRIKQNKNGW